MIKKVIPLLALVLSSSALAQVGIGTKKAANSAQLDIVSSERGVLLPRVELKAINDYSPIVGEKVESLLVYNTGNEKIKAGFYYWYLDMWNPLLSGNTFVDRKNKTFRIGINPENKQESLIITDTENNSVYIALSAIASSDVFVENLTNNQEFVTK
ncbi:hypothetical protein HMPREF9715_02272, partial [Myroides odoratimimus CIP 101113]